MNIKCFKNKNLAKEFNMKDMFLPPQIPMPLKENTIINTRRLVYFYRNHPVYSSVSLFC